jgi:hypothetical protein
MSALVTRADAAANCLHPGFVATRFADESGGLISRMAWLAKFFAISPAEGAQTIIYLASSPEEANVTGKYFYKCRPTTPSAPALDDRAALTLWERSAALAGMKEYSELSSPTFSPRVVDHRCIQCVRMIARHQQHRAINGAALVVDLIAVAMTPRAHLRDIDGDFLDRYALRRKLCNEAAARGK